MIAITAFVCIWLMFIIGVMVAMLTESIRDRNTGVSFVATLSIIAAMLCLKLLLPALL